MANPHSRARANELVRQQVEYLSARYWQWIDGLQVEKTREQTRRFMVREVRKAQRMTGAEYAEAVAALGID